MPAEISNLGGDSRCPNLDTWKPKHLPNIEGADFTWNKNEPDDEAQSTAGAGAGRLNA